MNKYGRLAQSHWRKTDPSRYAQIPDPTTFFTDLGEETERQVHELADRLAGPDPPEEGYLEKVGRLNMATFQAEELVLRELVLIPEPETSDQD